jgi:hypothetical protein
VQEDLPDMGHSGVEEILLLLLASADQPVAIRVVVDIMRFAL